MFQERKGNEIVFFNSFVKVHKLNLTFSTYQNGVLKKKVFVSRYLYRLFLSLLGPNKIEMTIEKTHSIKMGKKINGK